MAEQSNTWRNAIIRIGFAAYATSFLKRSMLKIKAKLGYKVYGTVFTLQPKNIRSKLHMRYGTSDISVFRMIYNQGEYECIRDISSPKIIIDLGANVGYSSVYFLNQFPDSNVICVEPDTANFEILRKNLQNYNERVSLHHKAIWSHATDLKVCRGDFRDGSDWSVTVRPCQPTETADITAISIMDLIKTHNIASIDLLKIDIEGAEKEIFASHASEWLPYVKNLVIEIHDEQCEEAVNQAILGMNYKKSHFSELSVYNFRNTDQ